MGGAGTVGGALYHYGAFGGGGYRPAHQVVALYGADGAVALYAVNAFGVGKNILEVFPSGSNTIGLDTPGRDIKRTSVVNATTSVV